MYRVGVFFWILAGLVWLGGVISIITELIRARGSLKSQETAKSQMTNNRIEESTAQIAGHPKPVHDFNFKFSNSIAQNMAYLNSIKEFQLNEQGN